MLKVEILVLPCVMMSVSKNRLGLHDIIGTVAKHSKLGNLVGIPVSYKQV